MVSELLDAIVSWRTLLVALLVFGFAPGALLRLIVLAFHRDDPCRSELLAELHAVPLLERPFWVLAQLEVALFEGIWPRVRAATSRIIHRGHLMSSRLRSITAHYKKRHRRRAEQDLGSRWSLEPGDKIRRSELHDRYGGGRQVGISPSRSSPNLFLFTNPRSGEQHGYYYDGWEADGSFHYTGHGQRGDQTVAGGNLAVVNHVKDGRALRVFQGASGVIQYVGEFVLDDQDPYSWNWAPSTVDGPVRQVIDFHLRPGRPVNDHRST
jgi:hypothetical protein